MKIKAIIVDDESRARSFLQKLCNLYYEDKIEIIDECNSVANAVNSIKKNNPDLVFLDIQMPDENGFELLNYFENIPFEIIFTTAHKDYAIEAIRNSALDYLLKPIAIPDFKSAIERLDLVLEEKNKFNRFQLLSENISNPSVGKQRIVFPSKIGFQVIHINKIILCKPDGSYTRIQTTEKEYITSRSFKETCEILAVESNFLKVHRGYLINCDYVENFKSEEFKLEMANDHIAYVSDKQFTKKELIDAITK